MWLTKKISQILLALLLRQQLRRELNILTVCAYLFFERYSRSPLKLEWRRQQQRLPKDSRLSLSPPSLSTIGSHQDIWVSGLLSGLRYGSVLSGNFQCKNKSRWHGSRWHGNSPGSSIMRKSGEEEEGGRGRKRCLWSLLELVSNCRQLVIPLALSAFKFILLSHLQVIPRREMNIISMSVYFVFGTRRTHKNKRQIGPLCKWHPIDQPPLAPDSRISNLAQLEWKINENFLPQVMKCGNFSHGVKIHSW